MNKELENLPAYFIIVTIFDENNFSQQKKPLYNFLIELINKRNKDKDIFKKILSSEYFIEKNFTLD